MLAVIDRLVSAAGAATALATGFSLSRLRFSANRSNSNSSFHASNGSSTSTSHVTAAASLFAPSARQPLIQIHAKLAEVLVVASPQAPVPNTLSSLQAAATEVRHTVDR